MSVGVAKLRALLADAHLRGSLRFDPDDGSFACFDDESGHMETIAFAADDDRSAGYIDIDEPHAAMIVSAVNVLPELLDEVEKLRSALAEAIALAEVPTGEWTHEHGLRRGELQRLL